MELLARTNPVIPLFRLLFSVFSLVLLFLTVFSIAKLLADYESVTYKPILGLTLGLFFFSYMTYTFGKGFLTKTRSFYFLKNAIRIRNFVTGRLTTIEKKTVRGFSTSKVPYRIWDFKQIIIYLDNNKKIEIMQFAYLNFNKIKKVLTENEFNYFGEEAYIWKWIDSRVYHFEDLTNESKTT